MIGVDWIAGLPTTEGGFDMIQNHVDLLSGKVHAVPTRATATAADAAEIIRDMCLRSGDGFPDVLVVDHDPKFTSEVFRAFVKSMGSCLIVGSAYHKNTNAKVERANGVIGDTLRAFANGRKDDWDRQLPLAVFAINNAASTLGDELTPFFIDRGAHPRLPLSVPTDCTPGGESPAHYARRMQEMERTVRELLTAAQQERKAKLDAGRVDTVFKVGDQVLLRSQCGPRSCSTRRTSASCVRGGTDRSRSRPARVPTLTRSRSRGGCCAARRSTWTGSSPSTSGPTLLRLQARFRTLGRRASTRWSCCSTAR
jgi:hypothetical protein